MLRLPSPPIILNIPQNAAGSSCFWLPSRLSPVLSSERSLIFGMAPPPQVSSIIFVICKTSSTKQAYSFCWPISSGAAAGVFAILDFAGRSPTRASAFWFSLPRTWSIRSGRVYRCGAPPQLRQLSEARRCEPDFWPHAVDGVALHFA